MGYLLQKSIFKRVLRNKRGASILLMSVFIVTFFSVLMVGVQSVQVYRIDQIQQARRLNEMNTAVEDLARLLRKNYDIAQVNSTNGRAPNCPAGTEMTSQRSGGGTIYFCQPQGLQCVTTGYGGVYCLSMNIQSPLIKGTNNKLELIAYKKEGEFPKEIGLKGKLARFIGKHTIAALDWTFDDQPESFSEKTRFLKGLFIERAYAAKIKMNRIKMKPLACTNQTRRRGRRNQRIDNNTELCRSCNGFNADPCLEISICNTPETQSCSQENKVKQSIIFLATF